MKPVAYYKTSFLDYLNGRSLIKEPSQLYRPIAYILELGGKRLRPVLTLMACDFFGEDSKEALPASMAVELFHNFSLVHDDIMDDAPLRRGAPTIHEKWDINSGILSGDALLIIAYRCLEGYKGQKLEALLSLFSKTAMEVCEGQQYDVDFEQRNDVTIPEYIRMISFKTAVLVGASLKMGAIVAGASEEEQESMYGFGLNLGIAFQLQDDYLDAFGNPETFGKQTGGDIKENKKTFLYLKAMQLAKKEDRGLLSQLFAEELEYNDEKIAAAKRIFEESGTVSAIKEEIERYTKAAFAQLEQLNKGNRDIGVFLDFGRALMERRV